MTTFIPYTGKIRLSQAQLRARRIMLEGNEISFDGTCATYANMVLNLRTFKALLRKDIIRFDRRTERYVLTELKPGSALTTFYPSDLKRAALIAKVEELRSRAGLSEEDFRNTLLEVAGQYHPKYLIARDCKAVLSMFGAAA